MRGGWEKGVVMPGSMEEEGRAVHGKCGRWANAISGSNGFPAGAPFGGEKEVAEFVGFAVGEEVGGEVEREVACEVSEAGEERGAIEGGEFGDE